VNYLNRSPSYRKPFKQCNSQTAAETGIDHVPGHDLQTEGRSVLADITLLSDKRRKNANHLAMLKIRKTRVDSLLMATGGEQHITSRLYITDLEAKQDFLMDTGANLCVYPRKYVCGSRTRSTYELAAANGTTVHTYGQKILTLNLGLRRLFTWNFVIVDISEPIIGADFLSHFHLIVDLKNCHLID